ncbi:unnamed protein product [Pneumocystis jirovecii]|uniref:NADH-ubiquinone oxidoreductase 21kDa subunit N-terminal domain-containing protein n=2 Tax=Pneumocystis jirovecii TaxID=42068 RepID=L0P8H5_PNEJI|nr:uncharacterized protein T551_01271 [Pneumocystis jirovecii RU7]KTW31198.1 hypothetical protein T551_01271 [Pneumocystis jirovecii RU7]CCJ28693.1 unnamed protein product [Pneumocystis jirovecii]
MTQKKEINTKFQVIDTDPHFFRVIRYARPSDYLIFIAGTIGFPAGIFLMEKWSPSMNQAKLIPGLRLGCFLGLCGGFLLAYQRSSLRLWGWRENIREIEMDKLEMQKKKAEDIPLYGKSRLSEDMQKIAAQNSKYSALKFSLFPWFNLVNHNDHGIDSSKYE